MKKLVLLLICIVILTVFVGFNYLLWEREGREKDLQNLEIQNSGNGATISALNREVKNLEDENKKLIEQASELNSEIAQEKIANVELLSEKAGLGDDIKERDEIITRLISFADKNNLGAPILKWIESINTLEYSIAYDLQYIYNDTGGLKMSRTEFSDFYSSNLQTIELKSMEIIDPSSYSSLPLSVSDLQNPSLNPAGKAVFLIVLDVTLKENPSSDFEVFANGENRMLFSLMYSNLKGDWVIAEIVAAPPEEELSNKTQ